jgi:acetoin utilization protein AcuB
MTRPIATVECHQSLAEASELMEEGGVQHLAVLDRGATVGVISQRDIFRLRAGKGVDPEVLPVAEAMSPDAYTIAPDTPLEEVAREMARRELGCALVADRRGLVGIFTMTDALRALADVLRK